MSDTNDPTVNRILGRENAIKLELIRQIMADWYEEANDAAEEALMAIQEIVDDDDIIGNMHAYRVPVDAEEEIERHNAYPQEVEEGEPD